MFLNKVYNSLDVTFNKIESKVISLEVGKDMLIKGKTACQLKIIGIKAGCAGIAGLAALTAVVTLPLFVLPFSIALAKDILANTPCIKQNTHKNSWVHQVKGIASVLPHASLKAGKIAFAKIWIPI
jgi:hypothetical protein